MEGRRRDSDAALGLFLEVGCVTVIAALISHLITKLLHERLQGVLHDVEAL